GVGVEPDAAGAEPAAGDNAGGHGDVAVVALPGAGAGGPREVDGEPGARRHERRGEVDAAAEVVLAVVGAARDARADAGAARARAPGRQQARLAERVLRPRVRDELEPEAGGRARGEHGRAVPWEPRRGRPCGRERCRGQHGRTPGPAHRRVSRKRAAPGSVRWVHAGPAVVAAAPDVGALTLRARVVHARDPLADGT